MQSNKWRLLLVFVHYSLELIHLYMPIHKHNHNNNPLHYHCCFSFLYILFQEFSHIFTFESLKKLSSCFLIAITEIFSLLFLIWTLFHEVPDILCHFYRLANFERVRLNPNTRLSTCYNCWHFYLFYVTEEVRSVDNSFEVPLWQHLPQSSLQRFLQLFFLILWNGFVFMEK